MKNKILTFIFCLIIFGFMILNLITKNEEISYTERRYLQKMPEISMRNLFNREISDNLEKYLTDHFILRDKFRSLKTIVNLNILNKKDTNNLYYKDGYIFKIEYPLKENNVINFSKKINSIYNNYLSGMNVYLSIIPEKNYYSKDEYISLDCDKLIDLVIKNTNSNIKYIDITDSLSLNDYYYTDIHWKQENLEKVVNKLSVNMNFEKMTDYKKNIYKDFKGSYYGQLGLNIEQDNLTYLTNDIINNAVVKDYDSDTTTIYELESLGKMDSYDVYLSGASPVIEITTNSESNKELIIFRDSFASSLAPLLLNGYRKITLLDIRYMNSSLIPKYIEFENQDILFLYGTSIINNSTILK